MEKKELDICFQSNKKYSCVLDQRGRSHVLYLYCEHQNCTGIRKLSLLSIQIKTLTISIREASCFLFLKQVSTSCRISWRMYKLFSHLWKNAEIATFFSSLTKCRHCCIREKSIIIFLSYSCFVHSLSLYFEEKIKLWEKSSWEFWHNNDAPMYSLYRRTFIYLFTNFCNNIIL